jgi:predicted metal-binding transcription factor (methanogenesis marker protein 9)
MLWTGKIRTKWPREKPAGLKHVLPPSKPLPCARALVRRVQFVEEDFLARKRRLENRTRLVDGNAKLRRAISLVSGKTPCSGYASLREQS